jgi:hypothetical protein
MIVLRYGADRRRAAEIVRLEQNGILLVVRTNDFNIDPGLIASCFGINESSVRVVEDNTEKDASDSNEYLRTDAYFATKGRPTSFLRLIAAVTRQKYNVLIAIILQSVAMVLAFLIVAFMSCFAGFAHLSTMILLLYMLFWVAVIAILPMLRKH